MPLEIPQSLSEEETKDEFSLRNFQEIIVALVLGITSVLILIKLPFGFTPNLIIVVIYFVGLFELYRFFTGNYFKWRLYRKSFHNVSFFDSRMDDFLNIKDIKNNVIIFKDNTLMSVVRVKPIDGSLLDEDELEVTIESYGATLKSIPHTIFVFSHSVEPNLDDFFDSTDQKIINRGGDYDDSLNRNKAKQKWLLEKMKETDARDRLNYFAILYKKKTLSMSFMDSVSFLFNFKNAHEADRQETSDKKTDKLIKDVNIAIATASKQLEKTNVEAELLNDDELMNLYSSYFLNVRGVGKSNLSPIMWLEE